MYVYVQTYGTCIIITSECIDNHEVQYMYTYVYKETQPLQDKDIPKTEGTSDHAVETSSDVERACDAESYFRVRLVHTNLLRQVVCGGIHGR